MNDILDRLQGLLPEQLDELAIKLGLADYVPTATPAARRNALAHWASAPGNQRRLLAALPAAADPWAWWRHHRELRRHTQVLGLRTGDSFLRIALDQLFVELDLVHASPARRPGLGHMGLGGALGVWGEQSRSLTQALADARATRDRDDFRGVVVVGLPGSGKTTLLQRCLVQSTEEAPALLLRCSTLQELGIGTLQPGDLRRWAEAEARRDGHPGAAAPLLAHQDRPWRFLLDGYDELSSDDDRRDFATWLAAEVRPWDRAEFVLTTRKAAWDRPEHGPLDSLLPAFLVLGLSQAARDQYIGKWFPIAAERELSPGATEVLRDKARRDGAEQARGLVEQVLRGADEHARDRIEKLTGNPLTLSIVCLVYREFGRLPDHRGDLYRRCFEVLIRGAKVDGQRSGLEPELGHVLLGPLAWQMQASSEELDSPKELPWAEVQRALDAARDRDPRTRARGAEELFRVLREGCGVLVSPDQQQVHFAHLTLQEHLAFEHARIEGLVPHLVAHAQDPRWREPILLGMADPTFRRAFFAGLLETPGRLAGLRELVRQCAREQEPPAEPFVALFQRASAPTPETPAEGWVGRVKRWVGLLPEAVPAPPVVSTADLAYALELFRTGAPEPIRQAVGPLVRHADPTVRRLAGEVVGVGTETSRATRWTVEALGMEFVRVEAGTFLMGASREPGPGHDPDAYDVEGPPHTVTLSQPFGLGRFPVTNAQYRRYVQARGAPEPGSFRQAGFDDPDMPVTGVSWEDAVGFCAWASAVSGVTVRLPTEAEWEWAARGPRGGRYPWGNEPAPDLEHAWYGAYGWDAAAMKWKEELGEHRDRVKGPSVVGGRPAGASECGAEDLAGNVWEWCQDAWRDNHPSNGKHAARHVLPTGVGAGQSPSAVLPDPRQELLYRAAALADPDEG
ncbi:SUMF1/EgtB/PvdO family nonheme iron enzyme, partial [Myxococcota bacterium]|nr:SUMF1/EgtB/PvdO family nonheme iron enzyme [Myxococcota bacterium]